MQIYVALISWKIWQKFNNLFYFLCTLNFSRVRVNFCCDAWERINCTAREWKSNWILAEDQSQNILVKTFNMKMCVKSKSENGNVEIVVEIFIFIFISTTCSQFFGNWERIETSLWRVYQFILSNLIWQRVWMKQTALDADFCCVFTWLWEFLLLFMF